MSYSDDIQYLALQGYQTSGIKTPALARRYANAVRSAAPYRPTVAELRGHGQPQIHHLSKTAKHLEQNQMNAAETSRGELSLSNLGVLLKRSPDPPTPYYLLIVSGVVDHSSPLDPDVGSNVKKTYSYKLDKRVWRAWQKKHNKFDETYDLFHWLRTDIKWLSIDSIAIAYPEVKK